MTFVRFVRFVSPHANLNLLACSPAYPCHLLAVINRAEIAAAAAAAGGREPAGGKEAAVRERLRRLRLVVEQVGALVMAGEGPPSRCLPSAWSAVVEAARASGQAARLFRITPLYAPSDCV